MAYMEIVFNKYELELTHEFAIANYSRKSTPIVLVEIKQDSLIGYGEASLPQYLKETQDSVIDWIKKLKIKNINSIDDIKNLIEKLSSSENVNYPGLAAIDIALHDILGKIQNKPVYQLYGVIPKDDIYTSYTIGISNEELLIRKIDDAKNYKLLKIKLGTQNDKIIVESIRKLTDKPIYVDVNQGWDDKYFALDMIHWLKEKNVLLIEQPMPINKSNEIEWLKKNSPLPIIADEAFQSIEDLERINDCYNGINIKLMKCGGINNAFNIIKKAKEFNLKIMLGCMTETSCAISAAKHLTPLADYIDMDGNLLIKNDPFISDINPDGKLILNKLPGLGIHKKI